MKELAPGFTAEVNAVSEEQWTSVIRQFSDANIFQTWPYGVARSERAGVSHLTLRRDGSIVAAAQARLAGRPKLRMGIAYFRWAPMCQHDPEIFRQVIRAIRLEYATRRGMVVRLVPPLCSDEAEPYREILEDEGYVFQPKARQYRTILMDIQPTLAELERGVHQKWRNSLNSARKQPAEFLEGDGDELFAAFEPIYAEMHERKQFSTDTQLSHFREAQRSLNADQKMRVVLCRIEGEVCAGGICSAIGDTGLYIFGATNDRALKTNSSYLVQWRMIEWFKERGCRFYNLNGINPEKNEGGYRFKSRLAGKFARDVYFLGPFDAYPNAAAKLAVGLMEKLRR